MIGIGVGVGLLGAPAATAGGGGNLFTAPEDFSNAAWAKPGITVTTNYGDPTFPTADQLVIPTPRLLMQTVGAAGVAGGGAGNITISGAWAVYSLTASVDGLPYTLAAEILSISGSTSLRLEIVLVGGFIQGRLENQSGVTATIGLAWMQLKQAASFSGYP